MSLNTFNRAKKYADKILKLKDIHVKVREHINPTLSLTLRENYRFYENYILQKSGGFTWVHKIQFTVNSQSPSSQYYMISNTGTGFNKNLDRKLIVLTEFSGDIDFQLQTVFEEPELYKYYIGCILFGAGFEGSYRAGIEHNTLDAFIRNLENYHDEWLQKCVMNGTNY